MIKYVIWDFNGTILDDRNLCHELLNELLKSEGSDLITYQKYLEVFGFPIKDYYMKAGIKFKNRSFKEMSEWFIENYQPLSLNLSLYEGVIETLKRLKEMNIKNICLSASKKDNLKEQLEHYKIIEYFDAVLGTNNIAALGKKEVGRIYLNENKIKGEECLLIGDTLADYFLAKELKIMPVIFTNGHQSKKRLSSLDAVSINNIEDLINTVKKEGKKDEKVF